MKYKVLSIKNQFSYLVCSGNKDVENRSWESDHRGDLLIHSSGKSEFDRIDSFFLPDKFNQEIKSLSKEFEFLEDSYNIMSPDLKRLFDLDTIAYNFYEKNNKSFFRCTAIIGKVELFDIVKDSNSIWALENNYHWIFKNPILFEKPILFIKGKLGIWNYETDKILK